MTSDKKNVRVIVDGTEYEKGTSASAHQVPEC